MSQQVRISYLLLARFEVLPILRRTTLMVVNYFRSWHKAVHQIRFTSQLYQTESELIQPVEAIAVVQTALYSDLSVS